MNDVLCSCHAGEDKRSRLLSSDPRLYVSMRAEDFNVHRSVLLSRDRSTWLVTIRRKIAAELRAANYSLPEIGKALNRDHSSIINLLRGKERA